MLWCVGAWCLAPVASVARLIYATSVALREAVGPLAAPAVAAFRVLQLIVCTQVVVVGFVVTNVLYRATLLVLLDMHHYALSGLNGRGVGDLVQMVLYGPSASSPVVL